MAVELSINEVAVAVAACTDKLQLLGQTTPAGCNVQCGIVLRGPHGWVHCNSKVSNHIHSTHHLHVTVM